MRYHRRPCAIEQFEPRKLLSTYTVNTLSDAVAPVTGQLTLRQAVVAANAHFGADTIAFDPKVFVSGALHTITLTLGQINFTDKSGATTVNGLGAKVIAVNANRNSRVFHFAAGVSVKLSGLTVTGGSGGLAKTTDVRYGGGIYNAGILTISNCTIEGNGVNIYGEVQGTVAGGGIFSTGTLTVISSTLQNNTAETADAQGAVPPGEGSFGGAIYSSGPLTLTADTVTNNRIAGGFDTSSPASGAGVYTGGTTTINSCTISGNIAIGGGFESNSGVGHGGDASGGGVFAAGTLSISNSTIESNSALGPDSYSVHPGGASGGGVYAEEKLTITNSVVSNNTARSGPDGGNKGGPLCAGGGIYAASSAKLSGDTINSNTLKGSSGGADGGGIYCRGTLSLSKSTVSGNTAAGQADEYTITNVYNSLGGGIDVLGASTIDSATISGNSVTGTGGKPYPSNAYPPTPGAAGNGGGIAAQGKMTITNCTITDNSAKGGDGGGGSNGVAGKNGGLASGGGVDSNNLLVVANSNISGNYATGGEGGHYHRSDEATGNGKYILGEPGNAYGGGIYNTNALTVTNSNVGNNTVDSGSSATSTGRHAGGGGIFAADLTLKGSSVSNNTVTSNATSYGGGIDGGIDGVGIFTGDTIDDNTLSGAAVLGGGVYVNGSLQITTSSISGNTATGDPSLVGSGSNAVAGNSYGGGVAGTGPIAVSDSSISDNNLYGAGGNFTETGTAQPGPIAGGSAMGGGIWAPAGLTIAESTIANNKCIGGSGSGASKTIAKKNGGNGEGGGVYSASELYIKDSTISGNLVYGGPGGFSYNPGGPRTYGKSGEADGGGIDDTQHTIVLDNTIVSGNTIGGVPLNDITGSVDVVSVNNLIGVGGGLTNGKNGNIVGVRYPQLSPLGFYGGTTQTMPPLQNSPAINAGSNGAIHSSKLIDQRGFPRIVGGTVDIGAAELQTGSISGYMFNDLNADGKPETGEPPLAGWGCFIDFNHDGSFNDNDIRVFSDSTGHFIFADLGPGTYTISQSTPTGWQLTQPKTLPYTVTLKSGQKITGINFGNVKLASISGIIFNVVNGTGAFEAGDTELAAGGINLDMLFGEAKIA